MNRDAFTIVPMDMVHRAGVIDLVRSCYGESYGVDYFYDADALGRELAGGRLKSVVALQGQRVVGHMALQLHHPGALACEAGNTIVRREMRGAGLMLKLVSHLNQLAIESGFCGYVHYPTTAHPVMQRASVTHGGVETGVMLACTSADSDFDHAGGEPRQRLAVTVAYQALAPMPERHLRRLPHRYARIISRMYRQMGAARSCGTDPDPGPGPHTEIQARYNHRWKSLYLSAGRIGKDLETSIGALLEQRRPKVCYVDLPVDCDGVDTAVQRLHGLGFFFAALLPEFVATDVLRMQRVDSPRAGDLEPALHNPDARRLLQFMLRDGDLRQTAREENLLENDDE